MKFVMTQSICPEGIEKLKADTNGQVEIIAEDNPDPNNYLDDMKDADALIVRIAKCDAHAIENSPNLKVIGRTGVGYDSVDVKKATELGIPVVITPGANNRSVAEHAVAMMFALSKNLYEGQVETRKGNWEIRGAHKAFELEGKTVGVIGLGAIGSRVANCAIELGMEVYGYDPYISIDAAWNLSSQVRHCVNLNDMLPLCDYITIHVPYLPTTKDTINVQTLALCKDGVKILNYARGELVNTEALLEAMETGKVSGYMTDFPSEAILGKPGIVCTPHLGASTPEAEDNCAVMAAKELSDYLKNGNIIHSVNMPEVNQPRAGGKRICIIHKNEPGMISQITALTTEAGLNIENMVNKSKKNMAYTMLDATGAVDKKLAEKLAAIPAVIRVRIL